MFARLTVETGDAQPPEIQFAAGDRVSIGRNRVNALVVQDGHASRRHAELFFSKGAWRLEDLRTKNGTKLDGVKIEQITKIQNGQIIGIGAVRLRFNADAFESTANGDAELGAPVVSPAIVPLLTGAPTDISATLLLTEELTAIRDFLSAAQNETVPATVVQLALLVVRTQTQANVCGFLGFDPDDDQLRIV
ncbi:MAG: FHA domain-containing protein, partial [Candidatus Acidiferrum sp.]